MLKSFLENKSTLTSYAITSLFKVLYFFRLEKMIFWIGQKLHLGFSVRWYGKTQPFWPAQYFTIKLWLLIVLQYGDVCEHCSTVYFFFNVVSKCWEEGLNNYLRFFMSMYGISFLFEQFY